MTNKQIIDFLNTLTPAKRAFLADYLTSDKNKLLFAKTKSRLGKADRVLCPYCSSAGIVKHGSFNGKTRYKCKQCLKHFNKATGWELAHTRKGDAFREYLNMLINSITIRSAASKLNVTDRTVFLWRQKIISTFSYLGDSFDPDVKKPDDKPYI